MRSTIDTKLQFDSKAHTHTQVHTDGCLSVYTMSLAQLLVQNVMGSGMINDHEQRTEETLNAETMIVLVIASNSTDYSAITFFVIRF